MLPQRVAPSHVGQSGPPVLDVEKPFLTKFQTFVLRIQLIQEQEIAQKVDVAGEMDSGVLIYQFYRLKMIVVSRKSLKSKKAFVLV